MISRKNLIPTTNVNSSDEKRSVGNNRSSGPPNKELAPPPMRAQGPAYPVHKVRDMRNLLTSTDTYGRFSHM